MESIGSREILYYIPFTDMPMPMGGLNILTVFNTGGGSPGLQTSTEPEFSASSIFLLT